jgi:multicomponent Na+:H+ antiporter subunit E
MNKLSLFSLTMSFISLMIFWIVMSGFLEWFQITLGVISVAGVMYVNYRLKTHQFFDDDMNDLAELRFGYAIYYILWMVVQIFLAGFHVLTVIIRPKMPIKTTMIRFKVDLPSAHAKMILGNSITLTPGTLTIDIVGDEFTVHALDEKSYEGIVNDSMPRQVLKLFEKSERQVISNIEITTHIKEGA